MPDHPSPSSSQIIWVDIVPDVLSRTQVSSADRQHLRIWSLVLNSQYIAHRVTVQTISGSILVAAGDADVAIDQIARFEDENQEWQTDWVPPSDVANPYPSYLILAILGLFHPLNVAGIFTSRAVWLSEGSAQAGLILGGEWFRTVTALTLHGDMPHVLSNLVIGGFFVIWLCRELGTGLGWFTILGSGILGNFVNALVQSNDHNSVGASTAVFGTIGLLSALRIAEGPKGSKDVLIPLMSGIILMALLGTGGERTDVGAHLFGLLSGLAIGVGLSVTIAKGKFPDARTQRLLGWLAAFVVILAWAAAFT